MILTRIGGAFFMYQVVKRDGKVVDFHIEKISAAITKAFEALNKEYHPNVIDLIALRVASDFESKVHDGQITVEEIQDSVLFFYIFFRRFLSIRSILFI